MKIEDCIKQNIGVRMDDELSIPKFSQVVNNYTDDICLLDFNKNNTGQPKSGDTYYFSLFYTEDSEKFTDSRIISVKDFVLSNEKYYDRTEGYKTFEEHPEAYEFIKDAIGRLTNLIESDMYHLCDVGLVMGSIANNLLDNGKILIDKFYSEQNKEKENEQEKN